jgi:hypothetical protein
MRDCSGSLVSIRNVPVDTEGILVVGSGSVSGVCTRGSGAVIARNMGVPGAGPSGTVVYGIYCTCGVWGADPAGLVTWTCRVTCLLSHA